MTAIETLETRTTTTELEVRKSDDGTVTLRGYAAVFDKLSDDLGGFREIIKRGAFDASLKGDSEIKALWGHNSDYVIGSRNNGTLKLKEDKNGLAIEIEPPESGFLRDLVAPVERGDVDKMSFGFRVRAGGSQWDEDDNGNIIRTLTNVRLFEVSPVAFPAYPDTTIAKRSLQEWLDERENDEPAFNATLARMRLKHKYFVKD